MPGRTIRMTPIMDKISADRLCPVIDSFNNNGDRIVTYIGAVYSKSTAIETVVFLTEKK